MCRCVIILFLSVHPAVEVVSHRHHRQFWLQPTLLCLQKNCKSASSCFVSLHMEFLTIFLTFVTLFNILSLNIPMGNLTLPHSQICLGPRHIFGCWSSVSTACHDFNHFSLFTRPPSERMDACLMLRYVEVWNRLRCAANFCLRRAANFCFHAESIESSRVEVKKIKK